MKFSKTIVALVFASIAANAVLIYFFAQQRADWQITRSKLYQYANAPANIIQGLNKLEKDENDAVVIRSKFRVYAGQPGTIKQTINRPGLAGVEFRVHENVFGPALNLLNRSAYPALSITNRNKDNFRPAMQIDQVGKGTIMVLKQARNPRAAPEYGDKYVSDAPFLIMRGGGVEGGESKVRTVFDGLGNLYFSVDGQQDKRGIYSPLPLVISSEEYVEIGSALVLQEQSSFKNIKCRPGAIAYVAGNFYFAKPTSRIIPLSLSGNNCAFYQVQLQ